jgi:hypothetical protein
MWIRPQVFVLMLPVLVIVRNVTIKSLAKFVRLVISTMRGSVNSVSLTVQYVGIILLVWGASHLIYQSMEHAKVQEYPTASPTPAESKAQHA